MRACIAGVSRTISLQAAHHRIAEGHLVGASVLSASEHLASRTGSTPDPDPEPRVETGGLVDLDARGVYSRAAERYWLLR